MLKHKWYRAAVVGIAAGFVIAPGITGAAAASTPPSVQPTGGHTRPDIKHVLLLSVDGMHQSDLAWYVRTYPHSALARLVAGGTEYTHAQTTFPSDSFPGMVAQLTGGGPGTTGVFYDDTYNHTLLAPGTLDCRTAAPGTEVAWTEAADRSQNPITLDAGQNIPAPALTALPTNTLAQTLASCAGHHPAILKMTPNRRRCSTRQPCR